MAVACQQLLDDDESDGIDWLSRSPDPKSSQLSFTNYTITIHPDFELEFFIQHILGWAI